MLAALPVADAVAQALPAIDLQARCRNSERTMIEMMADRTLQGRAFDTCMKSEEAARDAMQAAWHEIPPAYKSYCIRPRDYSPSYIEWIACVELMIDLKKLRAANPTKTVEVPGRCPSLQYAEDGSIIRVRTCAL